MKAVDVAVIGAGPAGIAAATQTARAGLSTLVLDEQAAPGGQIWRAAEAVATDRDRAAALADSYGGARDVLAALRASGAVLSQRADVIDVSSEREILWLDRGDGRLRETRAHALVIATGALERPVPFPGWTLPGVMGAGALQGAMKQGGLVPAGRLVLAGQGPLLLLVLRQVLRLGGAVAAVLDFGAGLPGAALRRLPQAAACDPRLLAKGAGLLATRARARIPAYRSIDGLSALGPNRVEAVAFTSGGERHDIPCDLLAVHDGVTPNTQLPRLLNLAHRWRTQDAAFAPLVDAAGRTSADGVWIAGDGAGIGGAELAGLRGAIAGLDVCRALGRPSRPGPRRRAARLAVARPFLAAAYPPRPVGAFVDDATVLCRCEAVTVGAIREAVRLGASGPNRAKTFTRCGMGPCQGRVCGGPLTRLVAETTGATPDSVGALRIRPPLKPVLLGDYAALLGRPDG